TMKVRKNPLPKRIVDILCFLLIGVFLPIVFIWDISVVLPAVHEPGSFMYNFTFAMALFILFNLKGNLAVCMMVDTSYDPKAMEAPPAESEEHKDWRHCEHCDCLTPPRSWHCKICDVCILKRDHHCLFTGCCIGHKNHRYFFIFLSYLFVGAIYALLYNCYYIFVINADLYFKPMTILIILFPFPLLLMGYWVALPLLILVLNLIVLLYSSIMMVLQVQHVWHGAVKAEKRIKNKYDNGLYENLRDVLGERMYLVWISPFSSSPLPHNGNSWKVSTTHQKEAE
ncbi:CG4676, partial [Drosophila busckii]